MMNRPAKESPRARLAVAFGALSIALVVALGACAVPMNMDSVMDEPHFAGVVLEVHDSSILVQVNEGEEARGSSDLMSVSLNVELSDSVTHFTTGDEVIVYFDGTIAESYPAQVNRVYAIVLVNSNANDDR
ncbi:MAG: YobA family protein [Coriobacteriales bacterium]|jgi:ribosomal protein L21E|nr:YobA family protein [Coriobacteriales bacterium]